MYEQDNKYPQMRSNTSAQPRASARPAPAGPRTNVASGSVRGGQRVPGSANAAPNFNRDAGTDNRSTVARPGINRPASEMLAEGRRAGAASGPVPTNAIFSANSPATQSSNLDRYRSNAQQHEARMQQRDTATAQQTQQQGLVSALGALLGQRSGQAPGANPLGTTATDPIAPGAVPQPTVAPPTAGVAEPVDTGLVDNRGGLVDNRGGQVDDLSGRREDRNNAEQLAATEAEAAKKRQQAMYGSGGGGYAPAAVADSSPYADPLNVMDLDLTAQSYGGSALDRLFGQRA